MPPLCLRIKLWGVAEPEHSSGFLSRGEAVGQREIIRVSPGAGEVVLQVIYIQVPQQGGRGSSPEGTSALAGCTSHSRPPTVSPSGACHSLRLQHRVC
ncbi:hypothetical protein O3P69_020159 [Scylla paramamosain]|uniref:Uncharacterized protein n=1 Tax=Scylla paramamosain TaxID=85552 RepID=A0AAW0TLE3_SCYPA